jgi:methyltransferase (TIGR00027 family)
MESSGGSKTAEMVAARRAAHRLIDSPLVFDDPLGMTIVAPSLSAVLRGNPRHFDNGPWARRLRAALVARSRFSEDSLASAFAGGVRQYVILGAGLDTFAYRNPFPELRVFEIDHPATQASKRKRLAAASVTIPPTTTFISVDLSREPLGAALAASSFQRDAPSFWAWLGVVMYLDRSAIRETLAFIGSLPKGTALVFDYGTPPAWYNLRHQFAVARLQKRLTAIGEPWKTLLKPAEARALLTGAGFSSIEDLNARAIDARYFAGRTDDLRVSAAAHLIRATV